MPFFGHFDFLCEEEIGGSEWVMQLDIKVSYDRGGKSPVPAGHTENGYWRFKTSK